jgi:hypothetical protein
VMSAGSVATSVAFEARSDGLFQCYRDPPNLGVCISFSRQVQKDTCNS